MTALTPDERASIIEQAMQRKFGKLITWERPVLLHTFGPNDLDVVETFETKLCDTKRQVQETLGRWPDEKILETALRLSNSSFTGESDWQALGSRDISELARAVPPPIAHGFGHPDFQVDFSYWGKMPHFTLAEALNLSVGVEPNAIPTEELNELSKDQKRGGKLWSAHEFLLKRAELFRRHFRTSGYGLNPESPRQLKTWIDEICLDVHPEFYAELEKRTKKPAPVETPVVAVSLSSQERDTLLKLVAAMACEGYKYDPTKVRSEAPSDIRNDLATVGLSMDSKTIRKWLKEAVDLVHPDYWTKT